MAQEGEGSHCSLRILVFATVASHPNPDWEFLRSQENYSDEHIHQDHREHIVSIDLELYSPANTQTLPESSARLKETTTHSKKQYSVKG